MTSLRSYRPRGAALAAGLLALAAVVSTGTPALADPSPTPSAPVPSTPGGGVPRGAPGTITWAVLPSSADGPDKRSTFSYTNIKPGTVIHDFVGVTNYSDQPVTFNVYATDAFNTASGSLGLLPAEQKPTDVGSWVTLNKTSVTIPPGDRKNESFSVTIPSTAAPGDHTGGIIASVDLAATNKTGTTVKVNPRIAVPLYLRVAGTAQAALTIESVSTSYRDTFNPLGGSADVTYTVHNTGNIRLHLTQEVTATGLFGFTVARAHPSAVEDLLPGSTHPVTVHLARVFPLGPMTLHITGTPAEVAGLPPTPKKPEAVSFSVSVWATPWLILLVLLVLVGGFFGGRWLLRVRRRRRDDVLAEAMAKARRETVEQLKQKATAARAGSGKS